MNTLKFRTHRLNTAIKHTLMTACLLGVGMTVNVSSFANVATQQNYQIQADTLAQAINQFAEQSGILLQYDARLVESKHSQGLNGNYSVDAGFAILLAPHGLQLQKTATGYSIITSPTQSRQARDVGQLKTIDVNVSGQANRSANAVNQLPVITVNAEQNGSAENGYLVKNITGIGIWGERSLQDTPYSMSVVSSDLIENVIAKDMNQIFKMNPVTQEAGNATTNYETQAVVIRGFNISTPIINGIAFANSDTTDPMINNIERVEIINGATGFLYGGGRVGGAVNYITKKSTIENLKNLTLGSYSGESIFGHIDLSGKFDENNIFGYRVNAFYQDGELASKKETKQKAISLVFDYQPTDKFYADIKYSYNDILRKGYHAHFAYIDDRASIKSNKFSGPDWLKKHMESNKVENNINWTINDIFSLRTNVFYEDMKIKRSSFQFAYVDNKINTNYYQQIMNTGRDENINYGVNIYFDSKFNIGSTKHILTTGYSLNSHKYYFANYGYNTIPFVGSLIEFKNLPEPSIWYNYSGTSVVNLGESPKLNSQRQHENILIGDDITFNENWSALVGANYASISPKYYTSNTGFDNSALTPTLSLIYKPIKNLTTYATYIESLEAGRIVGSRYANVNEILDAYISKQYEIGAKYNLFDEKALLTASLFRIEKANAYDDNTTVATLGSPTLTQDGKQVHQGLELTITGKLTKDLTVITGGTLMDLGIKKATDSTLEGRKPTEVATKMAKIFAEYNVPTIEGLYLSAGAYYTGKKFADSKNTDILPAYTLFDAGVRYTTKLGKYPTTFNLNLQNVTDKVYWTYSSQLGDPRTVAFSVKTQF